MSQVEEIGHEIVTNDLPCRFCGYNLRTLGMDGNCPECGDPVSETVRRSQLTRWDPEWLQLVFDDAGATLGTGIPAALLVPALWVTAVLGSPWFYLALPCIIIGCIGTCLCLPAISQFVLDVSEVASVGHRRWGWVSWYATILIFAACMLGVFGLGDFALAALGPAAVAIVLYPAFIAGAGETLACLTGNSGMVRLARNIRRTGIALAFFSLLGGVLTVQFLFQRPVWGAVLEASLFASVVIILPLGHTVLSVLSIVLSYGLRGELHQAIQLAQLKHDLRERGDEIDSRESQPSGID